MSKQIPVFSIIVPTHFSSGFISKLLLTVPKRNDIELIIVDDSNDNVENAKLNNVVKTNYESALIAKNIYKKGVCGARNTGLDLAKGKWVIFADSDDCFYKDMLSRKMDEYKDSSVDQVMFRYDSKKNNSEEESNRHRHAQYVFNKNKIKHPLVALVNTGTVCMRFISRETINSNNIRFHDSYKIAEDALFMTEVTASSKDYILDDAVLYTIYDHDDSVTRKIDYALFKNWIEAQYARNEVLKRLQDDVSYNKIKQTRLIILVKSLKQVGVKKTFSLNNYARSLNVSLVRVDEISYLLDKIWSKK